MSFRRLVASNLGTALRAASRPPVVRAMPRRNFMVGLQPGVEEQNITQEASTYQTCDLNMANSGAGRLK